SRPLLLLLGSERIVGQFPQNELAIELSLSDGALCDRLAKFVDPRVHRRHLQQPGSGRIRRLCRIPGRDVGFLWTLPGSDQPAEVLVSRIVQACHHPHPVPIMGHRPWSGQWLSTGYVTRVLNSESQPRPTPKAERAVTVPQNGPIPLQYSEGK